MPEAAHRNHGRKPSIVPALKTPLAPLVARAFARPDIPPSNRRSPSRRETLIRDVNDDYKLLFKMLFKAIELFDRCDDCETLIDAGKLFGYLEELAEDAVEEAWEGR